MLIFLRTTSKLLSSFLRVRILFSLQSFQFPIVRFQFIIKYTWLSISKQFSIYLKIIWIRLSSFYHCFNSQLNKHFIVHFIEQKQLLISVCFCVYSDVASFEYIRSSLEKTLLSNLEKDDGLPFQVKLYFHYEFIQIQRNLHLRMNLLWSVETLG